MAALGCSARAPAPLSAPAFERLAEVPDAGVADTAGQRAFSTTELVLHPPPMPARVRLLGRSATGVNVAPDGEVVLQIRGRGGLLRTLSSRQGKSLPRRHFVGSAFSPDGRHLAVVDERRKITVVSVPDAIVVATIDRGKQPQWIDGHTLGFRRGCAAMRVRIGSAPTLIGQGPGPCGNVVHIAGDYQVWWVADNARFRRGVLQTYRTLRRVELTTGRSEVVIQGDEEDPFMLPTVSPAGERVCYLRANFAVYCVLDHGEERVAPSGRRPLHFDESGRRLLFATGPTGATDSHIVIADFAARTLTSVPRAGREWWTFMPGGERVAGHGGRSNAIVYDLIQQWQVEVGDRRGEWEGIWTIPNDPNRLVAGRERGGTRDVFLVELPLPSGQ